MKRVTEHIEIRLLSGAICCSHDCDGLLMATVLIHKEAGKSTSNKSGGSSRQIRQEISLHLPFVV